MTSDKKTKNNSDSASLSKEITLDLNSLPNGSALIKVYRTIDGSVVKRRGDTVTIKIPQKTIVGAREKALSSSAYSKKHVLSGTVSGRQKKLSLKKTGIN